jgi:hypothetical protein
MILVHLVGFIIKEFCYEARPHEHKIHFTKVTFRNELTHHVS